MAADCRLEKQHFWLADRLVRTESKYWTNAGFEVAEGSGMICGSTAMLKDTKERLEKAGLTEGDNSKPAIRH